MRVTNRSLFKPRVRGNHKIENRADEATVYLYDEISWLGIQAEKFVKDLNAITAKTINIRVNSPGGSVFDGTAIFNAIKQHKSRVIAHIDGLAASIASVIVMAADEVRMAENAFLMIHDPWSIVIGNAQDMRDEADLLEKVGGTIARAFTDKSGKKEEEILDLMAAETWFTAQEALDAGFIDAVDTEKQEKAQVTMFDLSAFANVPEQLTEQRQPPTARDLERILRDAGCSAKMAKSILANGFDEDQRDVDAGDEPIQAKAEDQRDVEAPAQRDVVQPKPPKRDRTADLLIRAEQIAPAKTRKEKVRDEDHISV